VLLDPILTAGLKTRKAPGALDPIVVLPPLGVQFKYGHVRYKPKWCKFLKLEIYRTFYVFAVDNINQGMECPLSFGFNMRDEERDELF